jgi:hypothetical protein
MDAKSIIIGLTCEDCYASYSKEPLYEWQDELYVYFDLRGATRCFCRKCMSYGKNGSIARLSYEDDYDYPKYGAKTITEIIKQL